MFKISVLKNYKDWQLLAKVKERFNSWKLLKDLKEFNPVEVAEYASVNNMFEELVSI